MTHVHRTGPHHLTLPGARGTLPLDPPVIMGILNVTPDSFSDGGQWLDTAAAVAHGRAMARDGAAIIDLGGESTRPGATAVSAEEQLRRVLPVIRELSDLVLSIDTRSATVAQAALDAGASLINDVSAGSDPRMFALAAERGVPLVLMHMRGTPETMQQQPVYDHVVEDVLSYLLERSLAAMAAGVKREQIVLDPGIGFGKTAEHNWTLLAHLDRLTATGFPVLLGVSRKRFLGLLHRHADGTPMRGEELAPATAAITALGVAAGARMFRVHDVAINRIAADTAARWRAAPAH